MGGIISRRGDASVVLPVAPEAAAPASSEESEHSGHGTAGEEESGALSKALGVEALKEDEHSGEVVALTLKQGDGSTFAINVPLDHTISQMHTLISRRMGPSRYPSYALRLIFKAKVLTMHAEQTVRSFDLTDGDTIQLVVVRSATPVDASHALPSALALLLALRCQAHIADDDHSVRALTVCLHACR